MDHRNLGLALCVLAALALATGCKLVKNEPAGGEATGKAGSEGSALDARAAAMWEEQVLPHLQQEAVALAALEPAVRDGLDGPGAEHAYRAGGEGTPWAFSTVFEGTIVSADTDTRAATAALDVDGDGAADATLQLGPVIQGTALRDVLPFVSFSEFADQIEFASFSRSLNRQAYERTLADLPRENLVGRRVTGFGAFTLRDAGEAIVVTPVTMDVGAAP